MADRRVLTLVLPVQEKKRQHVVGPGRKLCPPRRDRRADRSQQSHCPDQDRHRHPHPVDPDVVDGDERLADVEVRRIARDVCECGVSEGFGQGFGDVGDAAGQMVAAFGASGEIPVTYRLDGVC